MALNYLFLLELITFSMSRFFKIQWSRSRCQPFSNSLTKSRTENCSYHTGAKFGPCPGLPCKFIWEFDETTYAMVL